MARQSGASFLFKRALWGLARNPTTTNGRAAVTVSNAAYNAVMIAVILTGLTLGYIGVTASNSASCSAATGGNGGAQALNRSKIGGTGLSSGSAITPTTSKESRS